MAMRRYGHLPSAFAEELGSITPSIDRNLKYYPCSVKLKDDRVLICVYIVQDEPYFGLWGVYPEDDRGKSWVRIEDVKSIAESPRRLPARFATQLYAAGESVMGGTFFTVVVADGSSESFLTGNAVDFVRYPRGKGPGDVMRVIPHEGNANISQPCPEYYWCLYSE